MCCWLPHGLPSQQSSYPTLPAPLAHKTPFPVVNQIFDALDDFLALR